MPPAIHPPQRSTEAERDPVARTVNLAWQLQKRRLEAEARAADPQVRLDALERRCEALESALAQLAGVLDDVDTVARYAAERVDVLHTSTPDTFPT